MNKENYSFNKVEEALIKTETNDLRKETEKEITEEDLENLANSKILDIDSRAENLETAGKNFLQRANDLINLSPEEFNKIKEDYGIVEKLEAITEKAKKLAAIAKEKLKIVIAGGMIAFTMSSGESLEAANISKYFNEEGKIITRTESSDQQERITKKVYKEKIKEWVEKTLTDKKERSAIVIIEEDGNQVFLEKEDSETNVDYQGLLINNLTNKIDESFLRVIKNNHPESVIEYIHSHPLEASVNAGIISANLVEQIRSGKIKPFPLPPSIVDIKFLIGTNKVINIFNLKNKFKHKVIDPTGVWEYSVDENHPYIQKIKRGYKNEEDIDEEIKKDFEEGFSFKKEIFFEITKSLEKGKEINNNEVIKKFVQEYKDHGINLSYTSYENINNIEE